MNCDITLHELLQLKGAEGISVGYRQKLGRIDCGITMPRAGKQN